MIREAGHMLHHDQPQQLAQLIERFVNQQFLPQQS